MATAGLRFPPADNATTTVVGASATSVEIIAANTNRVKVTIRNDSNSRLYLRYGGTASKTDHGFVIEAQESHVATNYTGLIVGIWIPLVQVAGNARVTEETP